MRPAARLQAAIELADLVLQSAVAGGAAADTAVRHYFRTRRYAGSADRRAIRELLYDAIRFSAERPPSGRALLLGLARAQRPDLLPLFDGSPHAPAPVAADEPATQETLVPEWLAPAFAARFGADQEAEARALIARAPLDIRVNGARATPAEVQATLPVAASPIPGFEDTLPLALRLADALPLEETQAWRAGLLEIQDAGSQLVAALAGARPGETVVDLCAGAGGKTLALADAMRGTGRLVACDTDRRRLAAMTPRLARAGLAGFVERRLLDPGREGEALADLAGAADLVLVDAPCSGTGTWRRNPELRWRLTPARLARLLQLQRSLIAMAARLVRPGGRLVYAVCSVLPAEGRDQAATPIDGFMSDTLRELSPGRDGCDGFAMAKLIRKER